MKTIVIAGVIAGLIILYMTLKLKADLRGTNGGFVPGGSGRVGGGATGTW